MESYRVVWVVKKNVSRMDNLRSKGLDLQDMSHAYKSHVLYKMQTKMHGPDLIVHVQSPSSYTFIVHILYTVS